MVKSLNELNNIIIVTGEDYFLIEEEVDSVISLFPDGRNDIDCVFYGDDILSDVLFECNNLPFMAERRLIVIRRTGTLKAEEKRAFDDYIKNPSQTSVLLIIDDNRVFKDYYKKVETKEFNRLDTFKVSERAVELAEKNNVKIDRVAANLLAEYTDRYMSRVNIEIKKLAAYIGDCGLITIEDVKECVHPESDYQIYQFISAATKGNPSKAIEISESLLNSGTAEIVLLSSLINHYRKLLHLSLNMKDKTDAELAKILKAPLFSISKDKQTLKFYTQKSLKNIIDKLYDLEFSFKSGKMSEEMAFKTAVSFVLVKDKK